jgi:hypothetical protein
MVKVSLITAKNSNNLLRGTLGDKKPVKVIKGRKSRSYRCYIVGLKPKPQENPDQVSCFTIMLICCSQLDEAAANDIPCLPAATRPILNVFKKMLTKIQILVGVFI